MQVISSSFPVFSKVGRSHPLPMRAWSVLCWYSQMAVRIDARVFVRQGRQTRPWCSLMRPVQLHSPMQHCSSCMTHTPAPAL